MSHLHAISNLTQRLAERLDNRQNSNYACQILSLIERLETQAGALEKIRAARNPLDTDAAHSRKVAKAAEKLRIASDPIYRQINEIFVAGRGEVEKEIMAQSGLVEGNYSAEIRAAFRGMDDKQRTDTLNSALQEGNSEVIAAVCLSPAILSGIGQDSQNRFIDSIRQQKAPELLQESEDIAEAFEVAGAARTAAQAMFDENYNIEEQTAINRAESEASVAEIALSNAITGTAAD